MTVIWCMASETWSATDRISLLFWTIFYTFTPLITWKNKILKKWKKSWGYYHFFINHNHMMYGSWDIFCNFGPFFTIITQKIKILKNWKKCQEISSFYTSVPKVMIVYYMVPEIWQVTIVSVIFHFGLFFALLST